MQNYLMILEVSRKQDYIFAKKRLKENAARSAVIRWVTSSPFFQEAAGALYQEEQNLVYSGGGHTVLQFESEDGARAFAQQVTQAAMERYEGLELFVKLLAYDEKLSPGENLKALSAALEKKKSLRTGSFRRMSLGVEELDGMTFRPTRRGTEELELPEPLEAPEGWRYPVDFKDVAGKDNFLAVVHADGNAMGTRVSRIYAAGADSWDDCCDRLYRFSKGIQQDFEDAFREMSEEVVRLLGDKLERGLLPLRPVILAGDDVCFVTRGELGLECARIFLEKLSAKSNSEDGAPYSACAGVAMVHQKYPFHRAYDLAEELCSSAKKFGVGLDEHSRVSAMDWHIEFGQLKDSLSQLREDYETEDGGRMELRPVAVIVPQPVEETEEARFRSYDFFRAMCRSMQGEYGKIARNKLKELRTALRQGEKEAAFFLEDREISDLLYHSFESRYHRDAERWEKYREALTEGRSLEKQAFRQLGEESRCLMFDGIEMIDHCKFLEEVGTCPNE